VAAVAQGITVEKPARNLDRARLNNAPFVSPAVRKSREINAARETDADSRLQVLSGGDEASTRSRLKLDSASEKGIRDARSSPSPADAASFNRELMAELLRERQRMQSVEDNFVKLRTENQAIQKSLITMRTQLAQLTQDAQSRYSSPLVYGLTGFAALLAVGVIGLWWRQTQVRSSAQWWLHSQQAAFAASRQHAAPDSEFSESQLMRPVPTAAGAFSVSALMPGESATQRVVVPDEPAVITRPTPFVATAPASIPQPLTDSPRELSVDELMDLEQQAEFFLAIGQDEAAIELLMSHVRSDGGISPLPYLKLLEIYHQRGEEEAYERIRERFNQRFNSLVPTWNAGLQNGRSLEDYPDTMAQLQVIWSTKGRAVETLNASLFRRNQSDEAFDLPAYRELLLLQSMARDLVDQTENVATTQVDVLLPLVNEPTEEPISRLSATTRPAALAQLTQTVDLDVSPHQEFGQEVRQIEELESRYSSLNQSFKV
jgi:pilus assembly protein FimV